MLSLMTKNASAAALTFALLLAAGWQGALGAEEKPPLKGLLDGNFILLDEPVPAPQEARVKDAEGQELGFADFEGRVLLVNFWATWCAPCVREMPSLDRLQAKLGSEGLTVMAVSNDRGGLKKAAPFYEEHGLDHLDIYLDPKGHFAQDLAVTGLPTSIVIDHRGRLIGALQGPLEWDGPEAVELLHFYLERRNTEVTGG